MVKTGLLLQPQDADGFEQAQSAQAVHISGVLGALKTYSHMALCAQVVDFIRLGFLHDAYQVTGVTQVAIVQFEAGILYVLVLIDVVYALGIETRGAALDAVYGVALFKQEFGEV